MLLGVIEDKGDKKEVALYGDPFEDLSHYILFILGTSMSTVDKISMIEKYLDGYQTPKNTSGIENYEKIKNIFGVHCRIPRIKS
jgi:hypothetical protein